MRKGVPIHHLALSKGVKTGITVGGEYESLDACIAARVDPERWLMGKINSWVMSKIIAWHRLKVLIEAHANEAGLEKSERDSRKRKFR